MDFNQCLILYADERIAGSCIIWIFISVYSFLSRPVAGLFVVVPTCFSLFSAWGDISQTWFSIDILMTWSLELCLLLKPRTKCTHSCPLYIISLIIHFSHSSLDWGESPTVRTMALWYGAQISFLVLALFSPRRWVHITPALQISLLSPSMSPFLLPVSNLPLPLLCKGNCEYIENPPE